MFPLQSYSDSDMASSNIRGTSYTNFVYSTSVSRISTPCYNNAVNYQGSSCSDYSVQESLNGQIFYNQIVKPTRDADYPLCCIEHRTLGRHRGQVMNRRPEKFITKRKRRTVFTTQQILALEKIFNKKPHVNRQERQVLMERLNVSERVIKLWFKNRRRLSGQKEIKPTVNYISDSSGEETENKLNLDYVQSRINEPDEFGYVTLDDRAMKELITVIDSLLTDVDLDETYMDLNNKTSFNLLNYEPISPISIHCNGDENICFPKWEHYEPEESLRRLFDVQALITKETLMIENIIKSYET